MKTIMSILLACTITIGGILFVNLLSDARAVHAQNACDASSFEGGYGYALSGYSYDAQGNLYVLAGAGRMVADGKGGVTGADTFSLDGTISRRTYTGTYSMNADCTGSMVLQVPGTTGAAHGDIVAVNNAREINFIQTDPNVIFSGVFKRQTQ